MSQALYRKWRPQTWEEVTGQPHVVATLRNALAAGKIAHAYLFAGPRGTGKTTTARLLAKAVNCLAEELAARPCGQCQHCQAVSQGRFLDLIEIDAASNTSVEDVRDLRDKINFAPNQGRYKVYIIDEVHMLSTAAFNALLKTLEEPPPHAIFVLATTEVHKIPATVLSRCQRHEFRRIPVADIVALLRKISQAEKIAIEEDALVLIARQATGAMRDAISLLDQLASTGETITLAMAQAVLGTAASQAVLDLVQALIDERADLGLEIIQTALDAGSDARQFARQVVDYLRDVMLVKTQNADQVEATPEIRQVLEHHAEAFTIPQLLHTLRCFNQAASESRSLWQPSLPLEIAFLEAQTGPRPEGTAGIPASAAPQGVRAASQASRAAAAPAASAVPAAPVESAARPAPAVPEMTQLWQKILAQVRQANPTVYGILNSCQPFWARSDELVLNFASEIVKSKMEKAEYLELVGRVLQQVLNREVRVRCNVDTTRRDQIPAGVDSNGMVAAAVRDLGGEIVDIQ